MDGNFIDMLLRFLIQSQGRPPVPQDYAGPSTMGGLGGMLEASALQKGGVRPPPVSLMPPPAQSGMGGVSKVKPGDSGRVDYRDLNSVFTKIKKQ